MMLNIHLEQYIFRLHVYKKLKYSNQFIKLKMDFPSIFRRSALGGGFIGQNSPSSVLFTSSSFFKSRLEPGD